MQKLSYTLTDKMLKLCSSSEIDFILYCTQFQNEMGQVKGLDYKYVCCDLNICKQTFFNIIHNLHEKGIIVVDYSNKKSTRKKSNWDFTFVDNAFNQYKDYRNGYLKTNKFFIHEIDFRKTKLNIKKVIIKLLKVYRENANSFKISLDKMMQWLNVKTDEQMEECLEVIKKYFSITITGRLLNIKLKRYNQKFTDSDLYKKIKHKVKVFCKEYNVNYVLSDINDLYFVASNRKNNNKFSRFISAFIDTSLQYGSIQPALVNKIVCE